MPHIFTMMIHTTRRVINILMAQVSFPIVLPRVGLRERLPSTPNQVQGSKNSQNSISGGWGNINVDNNKGFSLNNYVLAFIAMLNSQSCSLSA